MKNLLRDKVITELRVIEKKRERSSASAASDRLRDFAWRLNKNSAMLPKNMAICEEYKKCGKAQCRCNSGQLHGPYYFRFYRVDGRLKKSYVRKADATNLWESYSAKREIQRKRVADRKAFAGLSRNLRRIDELTTEMISTGAGGGPR